MEMADVNKDGRRRQKRNTACDVLAEMFPKIQIGDYRLVGQYAYDDGGERVYVMEVNVDEKAFQGVGFSKKKARSMAAENALVHRGRLERLSEEPHDPEGEPYFWSDFTADHIDKNSSLYFDFADGKFDMDMEEDDEEWMESLVFEVEDENQHLIGKNTISILSELYPETSYKLVSAVFDKHKIYFVMSTFVNGMDFKGSGPNKRLAKARAAREALKTIYKMEFGILEDGMPVYEGDEQIWRWYKNKLEERAMRTDFSKTAKNPLKEIHELYPDIKFNFPYQSDRPESDTKFTAQVQVDGQVYEGESTSKKLAKVNVAEAVIEALTKSGMYDKKMKEIEERKKARDIKRLAERPKFVLDNFRSSVTKLNEMRPNVEFRVLAETPLKNTCITAFTVGVVVDGKEYVSVGKNKRMAKLEVAEKVLKDLGSWTEEDDETKNKLLQELLESDNFQDSYSIRSQKGPVDLMKLVHKDMSRKEMLKMVNNQLGLNLPSHLFSNESDKGKRSGRPDSVNAMLDELDMLVESVLGSKSGQDSDAPGFRHGPPGRGGPGRLPQGSQTSRRSFDGHRERNNPRGISSSNWSNQNRSRPYEDRRRLSERNNQNTPNNHRGFNSRPPPNNPQAFSSHQQSSWYMNDQNRQWGHAKSWAEGFDSSQQKPPNFFWPPGADYGQNFPWPNYGRSDEITPFAGSQAPWDMGEQQQQQYNVAPPPPPPPPPPSTQSVQYPGFGAATGWQVPNYQGYDYSNSGGYARWGCQGADANPQPSK